MLPALRTVAADEMGGGAPRVTRERLKTGDRIDPDDRFRRCQLAGRDRAQRRAAMDESQLL